MAFTPPYARSSVRDHARGEGSLTRGPETSKGNASARIDTFYRTTHCTLCDLRLPAATTTALCAQCATSPVLAQRRLSARRALSELVTLCAQCAELDPHQVSELACQSLDCDVLYARLNAAVLVHSLTIAHE